MFAFPSIFLAILTLAACRAGEGAWLAVDVIASTLFGTLLLVNPRLVLDYMTYVRLDHVSVYMARNVGLFLFSSAALSYRAFSSGNQRERSAVSVSRSVTSLMIVLSALYAYLHYPEWNPRFAHVVIGGGVCWLLPYLRSALSRFTADRAESPAYVCFLVLDHFMSKTVGLAWFAFPQWLLRMQINTKPNGVSVTIARILGAILVGMSSASLSAARFTSAEAKSFVHRTILFTSAALLVLVVYGQSWDDSFSVTHMFVGILTAFFWAANSLFGFIYMEHLQDAEKANELARKAGKIAPAWMENRSEASMARASTGECASEELASNLDSNRQSSGWKTYEEGSHRRHLSQHCSRNGLRPTQRPEAKLVER